MSFVLAQRTSVPARIALTGPTNAGKTLSAIYLAVGIIQASNPDLPIEEVYKKIAFIDTERGRAKFYINRDDLEIPTYQFYYMEIEAPYHSEKLVQATKAADELVGPDGVIITDSLSHFWNYEGGILDRKNEKDMQGGNSYTNWAPFTKEHNRLITTILSPKANTIATMRSKMDYVLEANAQGKMAPKKVGLKPIQRDDTEFEFDVTLMLDHKHTATIVKDTTVLKQFADESDNIGMITPEHGKIISGWLNKGVDPTKLLEEQRTVILNEMQEVAKRSDIAKAWYQTEYKGRKASDLTFKEAKYALEKMREIEGA